MRGFFSQLTSGNRFIFTHPLLAFVITSMVSAMFVMSCLSPLFSIYVRDILHSGAFLYGVVSSAVGVRLIAGTQVVNKFHAQSKKTIVLTGLISCAVGVALLGIFRAISAAVATTFTMGFSISFVVVGVVRSSELHSCGLDASRTSGDAPGGPPSRLRAPPRKEIFRYFPTSFSRLSWEVTAQRRIRLFPESNVATGGIAFSWGLDKATWSLCAAKVCKLALAKLVRDEVEENLLLHAARLRFIDADQLIEDIVT